MRIFSNKYFLTCLFMALMLVSGYNQDALNNDIVVAKGATPHLIASNLLKVRLLMPKAMYILQTNLMIASCYGRPMVP